MYRRLKKCSNAIIRVKVYVRLYSDNSGKCEIQGKPFKDIPGPRSLPLIGTLYKYLPLIGERINIVN